MIKYRKGYKYQLAETYEIYIGIFLSAKIDRYLYLSDDGWLTIYAGYAWDGPSGPTIDTKSFMRGSLVHDALYQLLRNGLIDLFYRKTADKFLYTICREDGMLWFRAKYIYRAVRQFAQLAADPKSLKTVSIAGKN